MADEQYETELPEDVETDLENSETAESHDEDVDSALERETDDGKGGAVVPRADFDSFAEDEVENAQNEES
jgi:hypothetical protein